MSATQLGAIEVIGKPQVGVKDFLNESETLIADAVRSAAGANVNKLSGMRAMLVPQDKLSPDVMLAAAPVPARTTGRSMPFIAVGASAGGTQAIEYILRQLSADIAPVAIVQHMPEHFTKAFAERLDGLSPPAVQEAQNGMIMARGMCISPRGEAHAGGRTSRRNASCRQGWSSGQPAPSFR
jgi:two-component system chemotaxis response regulator CheB